MEKLSKKYLLENPQLVSSSQSVETLLNLPEKVLQFGTGVLLRGLPDFIIDKANKAGIFNGRIVVVKSTDLGGTDAFSEQDNLYTVCVRGVSGENLVSENIINTSISRVVAASSQWDEVLQTAASKELEIVISNTTEVGIVLLEEKISEGVPASFPGKLLSLLYHRFKHFSGDTSRGLIIVPTELISDNGDKLQRIILELAEFNVLEEAFKSWLQNACTFCNSLVDRIVPGAPKGAVAADIKESMSYEDNLLIMSEPYTLWAIAGDKKVSEKLSFIQVNAGAFVETDITKFKELKLRLLNGTHTMTCGLAYLAGFSTVKDAMNDTDFSAFLSHLLFQELAPSIPYDLTAEESEAFGRQVVDRFKNPFIEHFWINITLNYTQKIEMRVVSLLEEYYRKYQVVPAYMAAGFAAFIRFMECEQKEDGKYYGNFGGTDYWIQDQQAEAFSKLYSTYGSTFELVNKVLGHTDFWGTDLQKISGFAEQVSQNLDTLNKEGSRYLIRNIINQSGSNTK